MSLRETFLSSLSLRTPKKPNTMTKVIENQFYSKFVGSAITVMEHRRSLTIKEEDVRYAANALGFTIPEIVEMTPNDEFKEFTRKIVNDDYNMDVPIKPGAFKCLYAVYEAAKNGTVSSTLSKEGTAYKLESPTGVNANLFSRNLDDVEDDDGNDNDDDEELVAEEESDEELEVDDVSENEAEE